MWEFLLSIWGWILGLAIIGVLLIVLLLVASLMMKDMAKKWSDPETRKGCGCVLWIAAFLFVGMFLAFMADRCG